MSVFHNNALIGAGGGAADAAAAGPTRSLRFNSDDSAYLTRTPSSAGNRRTWTFSTWAKLSKLSSRYAFFQTSNSGFSLLGSIEYQSTGKFSVQWVGGSTYTLIGEGVRRDPSAWYHIVVAVDTTQATQANRVRLYVNGVEESFGSGTYPTQNADTGFNAAQAHNIGAFLPSAGVPYSDFYLADCFFIDGQQLEPTSFGAFDDSGVWQHAAYDGTFGTNGFHLLDFASESTVGHDSSGNENDFTANNFTNVEANNTDGVDNISNITQLKQNSSTVTTNLANLRSIMNTSVFQDADTDHTTHSIRVGGTVKKFGVKWSNLTGLTGISVRWQRSSTYDPDVRTSGTGITTSTVTLTSSRRQDTFSTTSTSGTILFEDVTSGDTNGFTLRCIEFKGYGTVTYPTNVENFTFPLADQDVLFDVPTNGNQSDTGAGGEVSGNYCCLNPLGTSSAAAPTNGNLEQSINVNGGGSAGTIAVTSGKYYWEITGTHNNQDAGGVGILRSEYADSTSMGSTGGVYYYSYLGTKVIDGSASSYGATWNGVGNTYTMGVALDLDSATKTVTFYKDGASQGAITLPSASYGWVPHNAHGSSTGSFDVVCNWGQKSFVYSAPSGFKTLCTTNLPAGTVPDGSEHFDIKLWTGNGSTDRDITGLNYSPDLTWIKIRNGVYGHFWFDTIRGATKDINSEANYAESTVATSLQSFESDGFNLGNSVYVNQNGETYVAWNWNAGANSDKTYTVTVVSDSGNKYRFDGHGTSAVTLDLAEGSTYVFDQSDSSNSGHPLRFSTTSDGTHNSGSEYTTGVTATGTPGSAGAKTTIVIPAGTVYSDLTSGGAVAGSYPMTQAFDGSTSTAGVRAVSGGGFVFGGSLGISYSSSVRIHSGASGIGTQQFKLNDGTATDMAENTFVTVASGSGTLNKLEITAGSTGNANIYLGAVEVDGVILQDNNSTPTLYYYCTNHSGMGGQVNTNSTAGSTRLSGSKNSERYNQDQNWGPGSTITGSWAFSDSVDNAFDGDLTTVSRAAASQATTINLPADVAFTSSVKLTGSLDLAGGQIYVKDGTDAFVNVSTGFNTSSTVNTVDITSLLTSPIKEIKLDSVGNGYCRMSGIEVDGKILASSSATPPAFPSINSVVKVNQDAGFSIVKYTGVGGSGVSTVAHSLNAAPSLIITKNLDFAGNWQTYHISLGKDKVQQLDLTNASTSISNYWGTSAPDSSVFGVLAPYHVNRSGEDVIAYCFAPVAGFSAFGSFTSNNSNDNQFVYLGFRPKLIIIKGDYASTSSWYVMDTSRDPDNIAEKILKAEVGNAEATSGLLDILSNGFKFRFSLGTNEVLYMAWAENPFQANGGLAR